MAFTTEELEAALQEFLPDSLSPSTSVQGSLNKEDLATQTLAVLANVMLKDPDTAYRLRYLASQKLVSYLNSALGLIDKLTNGTDGLRALKPVPLSELPPTTNISAAESALATFEAQLANNAIAQDSASSFLTAANGILKEMSPFVEVSTAPTLVNSLLPTLTSLRTQAEKISQQLARFNTVEATYRALDLRTLLLATLSRSIRTQLADLKISYGDEQELTDAARGSAIQLAAAMIAFEDAATTLTTAQNTMLEADLETDYTKTLGYHLDTGVWGSGQNGRTLSDTPAILEGSCGSTTYWDPTEWDADGVLDEGTTGVTVDFEGDLVAGVVPAAGGYTGYGPFYLQLETGILNYTTGVPHFSIEISDSVNTVKLLDTGSLVTGPGTLIQAGTIDHATGFVTFVTTVSLTNASVDAATSNYKRKPNNRTNYFQDSGCCWIPGNTDPAGVRANDILRIQTGGGPTASGGHEDRYKILEIINGITLKVSKFGSGPRMVEGGVPEPLHAISWKITRGTTTTRFSTNCPATELFWTSKGFDSSGVEEFYLGHTRAEDSEISVTNTLAAFGAYGHGAVLHPQKTTIFSGKGYGADSNGAMVWTSHAGYFTQTSSTLGGAIPTDGGNDYVLEITGPATTSLLNERYFIEPSLSPRADTIKLLGAGIPIGLPGAGGYSETEVLGFPNRRLVASDTHSSANFTTDGRVFLGLRQINIGADSSAFASSSEQGVDLKIQDPSASSPAAGTLYVAPGKYTNAQFARELRDQLNGTYLGGDKPYSTSPCDVIGTPSIGPSPFLLLYVAGYHGLSMLDGYVQLDGMVWKTPKVAFPGNYSESSIFLPIAAIVSNGVVLHLQPLIDSGAIPAGGVTAADDIVPDISNTVYSASNPAILRSSFLYAGPFGSSNSTWNVDWHDFTHATLANRFELSIGNGTQFQFLTATGTHLPSSVNNISRYLGFDSADNNPSTLSSTILLGQDTTAVKYSGVYTPSTRMDSGARTQSFTLTHPPTPGSLSITMAAQVTHEVIGQQMMQNSLLDTELFADLLITEGHGVQVTDDGAGNLQFLPILPTETFTPPATGTSHNPAFRPSAVGSDYSVLAGEGFSGTIDYATGELVITWGLSSPDERHTRLFQDPPGSFTGWVATHTDSTFPTPETGTIPLDNVIDHLSGVSGEIVVTYAAPSYDYEIYPVSKVMKDAADEKIQTTDTLTHYDTAHDFAAKYASDPANNPGVGDFMLCIKDMSPPSGYGLAHYGVRPHLMRIKAFVRTPNASGTENKDGILVHPVRYSIPTDHIERYPLEWNGPVKSAELGGYRFFKFYRANPFASSPNDFHDSFPLPGPAWNTPSTYSYNNWDWSNTTRNFYSHDYNQWTTASQPGDRLVFYPSGLGPTQQRKAIRDAHTGTPHKVELQSYISDQLGDPNTTAHDSYPFAIEDIIKAGHLLQVPLDSEWVRFTPIKRVLAGNLLELHNPIPDTLSFRYEDPAVPTAGIQYRIVENADLTKVFDLSDEFNWSSTDHTFLKRGPLTADVFGNEPQNIPALATAQDIARDGYFLEMQLGGALQRFPIVAVFTSASGTEKQSKVLVEASVLPAWRRGIRWRIVRESTERSKQILKQASSYAAPLRPNPGDRFCFWATSEDEVSFGKERGLPYVIEGTVQQIPTPPNIAESATIEDRVINTNKLLPRFSQGYVVAHRGPSVYAGRDALLNEIFKKLPAFPIASWQVLEQVLEEIRLQLAADNTSVLTVTPGSDGFLLNLNEDGRVASIAQGSGASWSTTILSGHLLETTFADSNGIYTDKKVFTYIDENTGPLLKLDPPIIVPVGTGSGPSSYSIKPGALIEIKKNDVTTVLSELEALQTRYKQMLAALATYGSDGFGGKDGNTGNLIRLLEDAGMDRAKDLLLEGKVKEFFELTSENASHSTYAVEQARAILGALFG
tara:strand:+ start:2360 stop:8131 length:5772 start_codon:yes stop_codon:yes gene_type:complete